MRWFAIAPKKKRRAGRIPPGANLFLDLAGEIFGITRGALFWIYERSPTSPEFAGRSSQKNEFFLKRELAVFVGAPAPSY
jgi:hypothetical protein